MKKKLKKVLLILGSILLSVMLIAVIASLLFFYRKPFIKGILEKQIEKRTGIHVTLGNLDYELFPLRIEAGAIEFRTKLDETEVDVFIEKLILKGNIHRIRKKMRPYFETIEAVGLRIVSNVAKSREKIVIEDLLHDLSSGMSFVKKISLKNSSLEFILPGENLTLRGVDFILTTSEAQGSFAYTLLCRKAEGIVLSPTFRFQNTTQGSGTLTLREKPALRGRFVFTSNHLSLAEKEEYLEEIDLSFDGEYSADKRELNLAILGIELPSFVNLSGPLNISFQDELFLLFRPTLRIEDLSRFLSMANDYLPQRIDGIEVRGSALFEGEARITPKHPDRKVSISGLAVLNPSHIRYRTPEYQLDSHVSGRFETEGFPDKGNISGRAKITKSSFAGKTLKAVGIDLDFPFVYNHEESKLHITSLKAKAITLGLDVHNTKLQIDAPQMMGQGVIDLKKRRFQLSQARIEMAPFSPFLVEADVGLGLENANSFSVLSSRISFQTLMEFFSFAIPQKIMDWEPEGWLDVQIKAHDFFREKQRVWEVSAKLEISDAKFHDPSFTAVGESLQPILTLEGTLDRTFNDIPFAAKLELSQGESLWKDFYVDWSKMPLQTTIRGRFHVSQRKLADISLQTIIPDFGRVDAEGNLELNEPLSADFRIKASAVELSSLYAFINQNRAVNQTQIELEGKAETQIDLKINKISLSILGYLGIRDASWTDKVKNLSLRGIEALIPLYYERNTLGETDAVAGLEKGYLIVHKLLSTHMDLSPLRFNISSKRNGYAIQPFELEIFGGEAFVGETSVEYGSNPLNFKALTSFSWKDVDLLRFPFSSPDFQLKGILSVDLPYVEISSNFVSTEGQAEVNAFGGNIAIENMHMEQPFSKSRTIFCDVKLSGLDLEKITDSIPFGRVTGIINGEIRDLALSYGQPERFNIRIESERRKGVSQRFSLKATNDLAILGTGEKTPLSPQSGWTRFIKEFRYNKIGIACSLRNDTFSLQGTIRKKGVEYLVKGSGLFAINVVNKQTRNQILFKDMLNRLKRIGQSK